eukprot:SM000018S03621  [mRNA]  locus=s18:330498:333045:- [translate_table: standard]
MDLKAALAAAARQLRRSTAAVSRPSLWSSIDGAPCGSPVQRLSTAASAHAPPETLVRVVPPGAEKRPPGWSILVLLLPPAAAFGLGTWQLQRRQRKVDLLQQREQRLQEEPVPLTLELKLAASSSQHVGGSGAGNTGPLEYRRVVCEGTLDEARSLFVGPRGRSVGGITEKGYYLITPVLPDAENGLCSRPPVLVNRGWVTEAWRREHDHNEGVDQVAALTGPVRTLTASPSGSGSVVTNDNRHQRSWWHFWSTGHEAKSAAVEGTAPPPVMRICGVVRSSEQPSAFVPANVPTAGQWFYMDVPAMAAACGLPPGTLLVDAIRDGGALEATLQGSPIPKEPSELVRQSVMPQDHLNYAITWYTLSAATAYIAYRRLHMVRAPMKSKGKL